MSTLTMNSFGGHFFSQGHPAGYFQGLPGLDENNVREIFPRRENDISILNATTTPLQNISHSSFSVSADTIPASSSSASASASVSASTSTSSSFISPFTTHHSRQDSPSSTHSAGSKRKATDEDFADDDDDNDGLQAAAIKRQRNTMAARKYRQKRLDKIADLERALEDMKSERDDFRIKLARKEAEVDALKEMLGKR